MFGFHEIYLSFLPGKEVFLTLDFTLANE